MNWYVQCPFLCICLLFLVSFYVVLAIGNVITKINPLGQVKAALKNGTDSTKCFSKSKVLVEATPNFSERKASYNLLFFMLQQCFLFYSSSKYVCC